MLAVALKVEKTFQVESSNLVYQKMSSSVKEKLKKPIAATEILADKSVLCPHMQ